MQVGFAKLAIQGVDTGVANAYVVTTSGGQNGVYTDGMLVEFKATNSNTASCTIAVDSGSVVGLTSAAGQSLAAGSISAGTWYRAMYNSTYSCFTVVAPASQVVTIGTISSAAPTHLVGLVSSGGVATAAAPIDATYAIDQSIAPTWTGAHIFSNSVTFNSTVSFAGGLSLTGASGQYAATLTGSSVTGHSLGLEVNAGTNASDFALLVNNQSGATQYLAINGQGSVTVGTPTGGAQGVGTINATGLFVNGAAVKTTNISSANPSASVGLAAVNGTALTFMTSDSAPALSQAIAPTWTAAHTFAPSSAVVAVTINAKANTTGLVINGGTNTSNTFLVEFITAQGSGFSSGLLLQAGTTSADLAMNIVNAANTLSYFAVYGDGHGTVGPSATLGLQWSGSGGVTVNASSGAPLIVEANGTEIFAVVGTTVPTVEGYGPVAAGFVDMTPDKGSFTGTSTGFSTVTNPTITWSKQGNQVLVTVGATGTGTSNASTFHISGLPASIQPTRTQLISVPQGSLLTVSDGVVTSPGVIVTAGSGVITFTSGNGTESWTSNGTKGVVIAFSFPYMLN